MTGTKADNRAVLPVWDNFYIKIKTQKGHPSGWPLHLFDAWQFPTLTWGDPTLPSALRRFTSEFGMGSGGTTALKPPGKFCINTHSCALINLYQLKIGLCFAKTSSAL